MSQSDQKNMNVLFQMCSNLIKIWNKKPVNLEECGAMLEKLKVLKFLLKLMRHAIVITDGSFFQVTLVECQIDFLPSQGSTLNIQHIVTASMRFTAFLLVR